jgi:predicted transcriptional regulator
MSTLNINRLRTKKLVSLFPGIHLRRLQRATNTSFNTTRYHVRNLERAGEIVCSEEGGLTRLYPVGFDERNRKLQALVLDKTTRKLITILLDGGPMGNRALSEQTKLAKSTVSEHMEALRRADVLRRKVDLDGSVSYEIENKEEIARVISAFQTNLLSIATDRFIDLWDI